MNDRSHANNRRAFLVQFAGASAALVAAGCSGATSLMPSGQAPFGLQSQTNNNSTYTLRSGEVVSFNRTDDLGSWQFSGSQRGMLLAASTTDGSHYSFSAPGRGPLGNFNYSAFNAGTSVAIAGATMRALDATSLSVDNGDSLSLLNNGTSRAAAQMKLAGETTSVALGLRPNPARAKGAAPDLSVACGWAIGDMGVGMAGVLLSFFTIETGIGFAAFCLAVIGDTSAYYHVVEACE